MSKEKVYTFFILFIGFFYPIIACFNYLKHSENNFATLVYRGLSLFFAIYIISKETLNYKKFTIYAFSFLFFWCLYLVRFISDIYVFEYLLIPSNGQFYYFSQGVLVTFVNMLAAYYAFKKIPLDYFINKLYILFIVINLLITIFVFIANRGSLQDLFTVRFGLSSEDDERVYLNPITIGISSITLIFLVLYKKNNNNYFILLPILISCFTNLLISGSLGPLLAFAVAISLYLFLKYKYFYILFFTIIISIVTFSISIYNTELSNNFILLSRVLQGSDAETVSTRSDLISLAIIQFKDGIFFGTHYYTLINNSSPHNLFIDILLSTGIFGLMFFLLPLFKILIKLYEHYLKNPVFPLFLINLILTQSSGYVFGASDFFIYMSIILSIISNKNNLIFTSNKL